jgi:DNA-directed RNA polymerase specialized sigma24 family protein
LIEHVERCLAGQEKRDRKIFWLYHRHGLKPKTISSLQGICLGQGGVETVLFRISASVRECLAHSGFLQRATAQAGGQP